MAHQDIYLTGNPQIVAKVVYRRHTNFSMEAIEQTINGSDKNGSGSVTISRNGDLVYKVYVNSSNMNEGTDGTTLIDNVELEVGGASVLISRQASGVEIWHDLSTPDSKAAGFKCMIGACGNTNTNAVGLVQVPLNFWFCHNQVLPYLPVTSSMRGQA